MNHDTYMDIRPIQLYPIPGDYYTLEATEAPIPGIPDFLSQIGDDIRQLTRDSLS